MAAVTTPAVKSVRDNAVKRLMRDLRTLQKEPLPCVSAVPLEKDIFVWHCNMRPDDGPYAGLTFHVVLLFPDTYPALPPRALLCNSIPHPNLFNWGNNKYLGKDYPYICLDILKDYTAGIPYAGWSSAYDVSTILAQLTSFLFAENIPQEYGGPIKARKDQTGVDAAIAALRAFQCPEPSCAHTIARPNPPLLVEYKTNTKSAAPAGVPRLVRSVSELAPIGSSMWRKLDGYMTKNIFDYLLFHELRQVHQCCRFFGGVVGKYRLTERRQLICFHRKVSFEEDILGFGFSTGVDEFGKPTYYIELDPLSYSAFKEDNVRLGVWSHRFTSFFPLVINEKHAVKSLPLAEDTIRKLAGMVTFRPEQAVTVLGQLMNKMVVDLVKLSDNGAPALLQSERALVGYCAFHHLLVAFAQRYPALIKAANDKVAQFIKYPSARHKKSTPDLGQFLVVLSMSSYTFMDVAIPLLRELFDRDVRWVIDAYPELATRTERGTVNYGISTCYRLRRHFKASITGKRLFMFQAYFLRVARGEYRTDPRVAFQRYNRSLGVPPQGAATALQKACGSIMTIKHFDEFFDFINVQRLPHGVLERMLVEAEASSINNEYHKLFWVKSPSGNGLTTGYGCMCAIDDIAIIRGRDGRMLCRCQAPNEYDATLKYARANNIRDARVRIVAAAPAATTTPVATETKTTAATTATVRVAAAPAKVVAPPAAPTPAFTLFTTPVVAPVVVATTPAAPAPVVVTAPSATPAAPVVALTPVVTPVVAVAPLPATPNPRLLAVQFSDEDQARARRWNAHLEAGGQFPTLSASSLAAHDMIQRQVQRQLKPSTRELAGYGAVVAGSVVATAASSTTTPVRAATGTAATAVATANARAGSNGRVAPKTWAVLPSVRPEVAAAAATAPTQAATVATPTPAAAAPAETEAKRSSKKGEKRSQLVSNRKDYVGPIRDAPVATIRGDGRRPASAPASSVVVIPVAAAVTPVTATPATPVVEAKRSSEVKRETATPVVSQWRVPSNVRPVEQQPVVDATVEPVVAEPEVTPAAATTTASKKEDTKEKQKVKRASTEWRPRSYRRDPFAPRIQSRPNLWKAPAAPELVAESDGFTKVARDRSVPNAPQPRRVPAAAATTPTTTTSAATPATTAATTATPRLPAVVVPVPAVTTPAGTAKVEDNGAGWTKVERRAKK